MALWGNKDQANNSPAFATTSVNLAPTAVNANTLFNNTTLGAFNNNGVAINAAVGQFGVDVSEAANTTTEGTKVAHAGWNLRTAGAGPLTSIVVAAAGSGYANSDTYVISGSTNATGNLVTNASGNVISFTTTSGGGVFTSATPTVSITTANGVGGSLTATAGGRAGRVQYETLVAMSTITGDSDSLPPVPTITISGQPSNTSVVEPATGTFSVTASATAGTLSYQWQKAEAGNTTFANISGATSSTYTTGATTVGADNGDVYRVVVSGTLGAAPVTSANATLTVVPTITISSQPSNTSVVEPATGTFSVTANTTSGTLSYQWQKAEAGNTTFANIVGANTNTYTTGATTVADDNGDVYRVVVSGTLGAAPVTSANATLTITT